MFDIQTEIYEEHVLETACLWLLRDKAVSDAAYDLSDLCELDERVEAHLDGLRLGDDKAWEVCRGQLDDMESGEAFAAMSVALCSDELKRVADILDVAGGDPEMARGVASALGWATLEQAQRVLPGLLYPQCPAALHHIGIAGSVAHRVDPGPSLGFALYSQDLRLRARALRAVGECQRGDLNKELDEAVSSDDEACRYAAAWSAVVLDRPAGPSALWDVAAGGGPFAEQASRAAVSRLDPADAEKRLRGLHHSDPRAAIAGAGALGCSASISWLLDDLAEPEMARLAGEAIHCITGVDWKEAGLEGSAPDGFSAGPNDDPADEDTDLDPDESLAWPEPEAVRRWWSQHAGEFDATQRYLLGKPMTPPWLERVLRSGSQPVRALAAWELAIRTPGHPLEEIRAPGFRQRQR